MKYVRLVILLFLGICFITACKNSHSSKSTDVNSRNHLKISLGQWSFHRELFNGEMNTQDFIRTAAKLEFDGVDYVNQFFPDKAEDVDFLGSLRLLTDSLNIENVMILVDESIDLGITDALERAKSVELHKQWVLAAKQLGCYAIRVNAQMTGDAEELMNRYSSSISMLARFALQHDIDILIENHGGISSNAAWLTALIRKINMDNVHVLADFNNWCIERENGELWGSPCIKEYDRYEGMKELMPVTKAISAKSFAFDESGNETLIDYHRMLNIIKSHDYKGYIGVEYEGKDLDPKEGVVKTKELLERCWN